MNNKRESYKWINKNWSINYSMLSIIAMHSLKEKKNTKSGTEREKFVTRGNRIVTEQKKKNERGSPTLTGDQSKLMTHAIITHRITVIEFFYMKKIYMNMFIINAINYI